MHPASNTCAIMNSFEQFVVIFLRVSNTFRANKSHIFVAHMHRDVNAIFLGLRCGNHDKIDYLT